MINHAKKCTAAWIKCHYCSESFDTHIIKNNMREELMEMGGKPHLGKSVSGQANCVHTKEVVLDAKTFLVSWK